MVRRFIFLLLPVIAAKITLAQVQDNAYTLPSVSGSWNAVCEDTASNSAYLVKHHAIAAHNQWEVFKLDLGSGTNSQSFGSTTDLSTFSSPKILSRGNMLYWINGKDKQVTAFNTSTNSVAWTQLIDRVHDLLFSVTGDTLFIGGDFTQLGAQFNRSIGALNRFTGAVLGWDPSQGGVHDFGVVKCLALNGGKLYAGGLFTVAGKNNLVQIDIAAQTIGGWAPNPNDTVSDLCVAGNRLYAVGKFTALYAQSRLRIGAFSLPSPALVSAVAFSASADDYVKQVEAYNGTLFFSGDFLSLNSQARVRIGSYDAGSNTLSSWNPGLLSSSVKLTRIRNRLYLTDPGGSLFRVYCLAPATPGNFTSSASSVCAGSSSVNFSIPTALYAVSYSWTYSGSGAVISGSGTNVNIDFAANASSGTLSAIAGSYCGAQSAPRSIAITVHPLPDANAGSADTITCFQASLPLNGTSLTPGVNFSWTGPNGFAATGANVFTPMHLPGNYFLSVTDTSTGCLSGDTVQIAIDTVNPNVTLPAQPALITCTAPALLDGASSTPNTGGWWRDVNDTSYTYHADPHSSAQLSNFYFIVQDQHNGCKDSLPFATTLFTDPPNYLLLSHALPTGVTPIDTLSCARDTIHLLGGSDTANTSFSWQALSSGDTLPNPAQLTAPGGYRLHIRRSDNGCADSSLLVFITQDITAPHLSITSNSTLLTCSNDSVQLEAQSLSTNATLSWSGPNGFAGGNPVMAGDTGWYVANVSWNVNGCETIDSIHIAFQPLLMVNAGADTLICRNATLQLAASVQGNQNNLVYSWSNGATSSSTLAQVNDTTMFIVSVSDGQACSGTDTVIVSVPPLMRDSLATFQACDGSGTGTIQAYAAGGIPPYQFSLDGGSFGSSPVFSNVPFGAHVITLMDSLGCTRSDSTLLDQFSNLPQPHFLAASSDMLGDTIVLVDVSNPRPDSVEWLLPAGAQIAGGTLFSPLVVLGDTGSFLFGLRAFYGACTLDTFKLIHVGPLDTSFANAANLNGIDSLWVYPNPNSGQFTLQVELYKKQNVVVQLFDGASVLHFQQNFSETDLISVPIQLSSALPNGNYLLRVIGEYDVRNLVVVLSR